MRHISFWWNLCARWQFMLARAARAAKAQALSQLEVHHFSRTFFHSQLGPLKGLRPQLFHLVSFPATGAIKQGHGTCQLLRDFYLDGCWNACEDSCNILVYVNMAKVQSANWFYARVNIQKMWKTHGFLRKTIYSDEQFLLERILEKLFVH